MLSDSVAVALIGLVGAIIGVVANVYIAIHSKPSNVKSTKTDRNNDLKRNPTSNRFPGSLLVASVIGLVVGLIVGVLVVKFINVSVTPTALFVEDFESNLQKWNDTSKYNAVLVQPGHDGSKHAAEIQYNVSYYGGGISAAVPSIRPFKTGEAYQMSVWCKADVNTDCLTFFRNQDTIVENDLRLDAKGTGDWQLLSKCWTMQNDEQSMVVALHAPTSSSKIQYDDVRVEKIHKC
jgi:hypothetical protein